MEDCPLATTRVFQPANKNAACDTGGKHAQTFSKPAIKGKRPPGSQANNTNKKTTPKQPECGGSKDHKDFRLAYSTHVSVPLTHPP